MTIIATQQGTVTGAYQCLGFPKKTGEDAFRDASTAWVVQPDGGEKTRVTVSAPSAEPLPPPVLAWPPNSYHAEGKAPPAGAKCTIVMEDYATDPATRVAWRVATITRTS